MEMFDQLKLKYQAVLNLIPMKGVRLHNLHMEGDKLYIKADAPNEDVKNDIWNQIKLVDADFSDLTADINVDSSLPQPQGEPKTYTVVAGDSLWKIADKHLGNGAHFPKIIAANPGKLKDEKSVIHPGDVLIIPED